MHNRSPISGGLLQLDAHAPKDMLLALLIHHFDPLLSHAARLRAAALVERFQHLELEPPMFTGDEEGASVGDVTQKVARTKIAVCNPQVTGLYRLEQRAEQRPFLSMA